MVQIKIKPPQRDFCTNLCKFYYGPKYAILAIRVHTYDNRFLLCALNELRRGRGNIEEGQKRKLLLTCLNTISHKYILYE